MTERRSRPRRTSEQITAIVREFRVSGNSRAAFARKRGIPASTLDLWLRKYGAGQTAEPEFVALELPSAPESPVRYELVFPSGVRLVIPPGFESSELVTLIAAVARC